MEILVRTYLIGILWQIISNVSEELFIPDPLNLVLLVLDFRTFSVTYVLFAIYQIRRAEYKFKMRAVQIFCLGM